MNRAGGYSLVELLLALLIFSFGAMAVAAMQLKALQVTRSASDAAAALLLAEDLMQRLMSNTGAYSVYAASFGREAVSEPANAEGCLDAGSCPATALARRDISAWRGLAEARPLAALQICLDRDTSMLELTLSWKSTPVGPGAASGQCPAGDEAAMAGRRAVTLRAPREAAP